jgi:transcriptional regulator GlxA family with amidase domain
MHRVAVVALDGVLAFDLSTPGEVLGRVRLPDGRSGYQVRVCGVSREVDAGAFRMRLRRGLADLSRADTVILPGIADISSPVPEALLHAVRRAARAGARVASICTGAFLLAATGLLDGRRATTHWAAAAELARRFPKIAVDPNVLFVDEGSLLTSAGATAGIDLCLHLVRRDYGVAAAAAASRLSVMPLERAGGQAQFIEHAPPPTDQVSLNRILDWLEEHLDDQSLSLEVIARRAAMSIRSLGRHFKAQTGTTPLKWLLQARVRRAQVLLETTKLPVEKIAASTGFGSVASLRAHFHRVAGTSPVAFRREFRGRAQLTAR